MEKIFREVRKFDSNVSLTKNERIKFPAHVHEEIEIIFVKRGGGTGFCDGRKYELVEGSFFMTFPNQVHHYTEDKKGEYIVIIVNPIVLHGFEDVFKEGKPVSSIYVPDKNDTVVRLVELACEDYSNDGYSPIISGYLTAILGKLLRHYTIDKSRASRDTVLKIMQYCAAHYKEKITVGDVADGLSISRSTVSHIFSEQLKMNFCEYINSLRLVDAEQLLKNKNYSITEVAGTSGFCDVRSFNRAFLKKHGMSPSAYRKK